jgi:RNA polymerase sigma factor (sigma-70 family)
MQVIRSHGYDLPRVRGSLDLEDLVQAGVLGMMRATQTYDPELGAWSTYAVQWIRQSVARTIQNESCAVRVPVHVQAQRYRRGERVGPRVGSLDAPLCPGSTTSRLDATPDLAALAAAADSTDHAHYRHLTETLLADVKGLDRRDREILRLRFADDPQTLTQVAERLGISRERVRQLERNALVKLRGAARRLRIVGPDE